MSVAMMTPTSNKRSRSGKKKVEQEIKPEIEKIFESVEKKVEDDVKNTILGHLGSYLEEPYAMIESYFQGQHLDRLVRHQLESYDHFINHQIQKTIEMFNPVRIHSEHDYDVENDTYGLEVVIYFENFKLYPPQIHENNGATKMMLPQEARLRNFTYASTMTVDIRIEYIVRNSGNEPTILRKFLPKINIGKMPIMVKSSVCVLTQNSHIQPIHTGECHMDCGGYFIIKGSEKTVLGQERAAENKIYCFDGRNTTKWSYYAEIKSVPDFKCISPKQIEMMIASKNNGFGHGLFITIPRIKQPIELFVLFRALGVMTDKEICSYILLDIDAPIHSEILEFLQASIIDANKYMTQEDAMRHITASVAYMPMGMDKETGARKKREFAKEVLDNDLFPHCSSLPQKLFLLGYMAKKLIQTSKGWIPLDDRDSYLNKRIELTGTLLNNLFRNYFNKLVKESTKQIVREINTGSWRSSEDFENIINMTNIYKILKSTTIENGINRALATGDFSVKQSSSTRVGVAQVLNRLTYVASLSHLRRINTPMEKSGEMVEPRKLHGTTFGFLCLTGDTEVLMSDRVTIKKIKDMKDGDRVNTVNPLSLMDEPSDIHSFFSKMPDKLFEITTISGRKIKATANHPFLVYTNLENKWVEVGDLRIGDRMIVRGINNEYERDELAHINEIEPEMVYDFTTTSNNHSFVASSFVVHNCPAESPEGQSIGIVKNLSYLTHVTIPTSSVSLRKYILPFIKNIEDIQEPRELYSQVKVFVNGAWLGVTDQPFELYKDMKDKKFKGIINIYTSIIFDFKLAEIKICNDGGRLTRPVLKVKDNRALVTKEIIDRLTTKELAWNDLLTSCRLDESVIEYIDPDEQNFAMIAMKSKDGSFSPDKNGREHYNYTHCEIHPSTIFGVLSSCIPFPEHNQAPRNTYQTAMAKQAMGVYATNFDQRMDKTAYVLNYPSRPLVETRVMNFLHLNQIPSGCQIHVAIMTHTGYNQEDSVLINKAAIDRGLFLATIYHTEKDEDKNIVRDEIIRCNPDKTKTKGIKFGNYDKLNAQGFIPENSLAENRDVIIAKIIPIKENRNDPTKPIKYEDQSKTFRTTEETYIDKNYTGRNGDGYNFAKVRVRILRKPVMGDKVSSRSGQKGTVGNIIPECDMPFTKEGLRPDIILNPHAIPSRMTIAQLKETLLGKVLLELGVFGDATSFGELDIKTISQELQRVGYESYGNEIMYNGLTGEQMEMSTFIGPVFYQRLKHMVNDKQHSRSIGPMVNLTRQPAEGRSRDGGFRVGEMERDVMLAHGASRFCRERLYDVSDKYSIHVCKKCGMTVSYNDGKKKGFDFTIHLCRTCGNTTDFARVEVPYAFKLMSQELQTINVATRIMTE
jgi:DNA-directed RNA polymerase beta subunit